MKSLRENEQSSFVRSFIEPGTALGAGTTSVNKRDLDFLLLELKMHREVQQCNR